MPSTFTLTTRLPHPPLLGTCLAPVCSWQMLCTASALYIANHQNDQAPVICTQNKRCFFLGCDYTFFAHLFWTPRQQKFIYFCVLLLHMCTNPRRMIIHFNKMASPPCPTTKFSHRTTTLHYTSAGKIHLVVFGQGGLCAQYVR